MRSIPAETLRLNCQIELLRQSQPGHRQPHAPGFFQGDSHVFDEVLHKESRIKIIVDDSWSKI